MQRQMWLTVKELRGKRLERVNKIAELVAGCKGREMPPETSEQIASLQREVDDHDSRISALEEVMYANDEEPTETETESRNDNDSNDNNDSDYNNRNYDRGNNREERERSSNSGGRYEEGETLVLPDGRRARVIQTGGKSRTNRNRREPIDHSPMAQARRRRASNDYREAYMSYLLSGEFNRRAIQMDSDVIGGFLTTPVQVYEKVMKIVDNLVFLRQLATKIGVKGAQSLGVPTLDTDPEDPDWTGEITAIDEDSATAFGRRDLRPWQLTKGIRMSEKWLRNATVSGWITANQDPAQGVSGPEDLVAKRFGYKFGVAEEQVFISGSGVGRALGLFTASTRGISTARDVQTGSSTNLTYAGLINAMMNQRAGYDNAWLVSRGFVSRTRQLVDNQSRPLYTDPLEFGKPPVILGSPYYMSEYVPSTWTTGLYVGMYGDFSYYLIADGQEMMTKRLNELFAMTNQIGYIGYMEVDGMPGMEDAFTRLITN